MNSAEFQLLLYCARSRPDVEATRNLVTRGIDWQILLKLAAQHCVRPILLESLKSICWDAVPKNIKLELTSFYKSNANKNLRYTAELLQLLDLFQKNTILSATFKGPVLALSVYGNIALREFSDLDVIVQEKDVRKAEDILTARGYQADFADRDYRSAFLSYQGQYAFRNSKTGISVDLHWQLFSRGKVPPLAEIWSELERVTIAGREVATLSCTDLALFLAAHGTKEGWRSLLWVCDFAELLRKYRDIDWLAIFHRAQRFHVSRPLLLAIALTSTLVDGPAPPELLHRARTCKVIQELAEEARIRLLCSVREGEFKEFLNELKSSELRQSFWSLLTFLTTRTVSDYRTMPLPKTLWGTYYLTRPFRLAIKGVAMMLHGDKSV